MLASIIGTLFHTDPEGAASVADALTTLGFQFDNEAATNIIERDELSEIARLDLLRGMIPVEIIEMMINHRATWQGLTWTMN